MKFYYLNLRLIFWGAPALRPWAALKPARLPARIWTSMEGAKKGHIIPFMGQLLPIVREFEPQEAPIREAALSTRIGAHLP